MVRKRRENEEMERERKWRYRDEMEREGGKFPPSPFPLFPLIFARFLSIYGICRECRKNLNTRIMKK